MYPYIIIAWNLLESLRCLTLSAMVRISCTRQDLLSRLLRDDSPPLLGDLEATGPRPWATSKSDRSHYETWGIMTGSWGFSKV